MLQTASVHFLYCVVDFISYGLIGTRSKDYASNLLSLYTKINYLKRFPCPCPRIGLVDLRIMLCYFRTFGKNWLPNKPSKFLFKDQIADKKNYDSLQIHFCFTKFWTKWLYFYINRSIFNTRFFEALVMPGLCFHN